MPLFSAAVTSVDWPSKTRAASGALSVLFCVAPKVGAGGSAAWTITNGTDTISVDFDSIITVTVSSLAGTFAFSIDTPTIVSGTFQWYYFHLPSNVGTAGIGSVLAAHIRNGTITAQTKTLLTNTLGANPVPGCSGTIDLLYSGLSHGPFFLWQGTDLPDTTNEARAVSNGSVAPESYADSRILIDLRDDTIDDKTGDAGVITGSPVFADATGLADKFGKYFNYTHRYNFKGASGTLTSRTNLSRLGGDLVVLGGSTGARAGTWPNGRSGARFGNGNPDTLFLNMIMQADTADAGRPITDAQNSTMILVGWADSSNRSSNWAPMSSNAVTNHLAQFHGLLRPRIDDGGANEIATDLRAFGTPCVMVWRYGSGSADIFINKRKSAVLAGVLTAGTGNNVRLGCNMAGSNIADFVIQEAGLLAETPDDADIFALVDALAAYHQAILNPNYVIGLEGSSSMAGAHDSIVIGGIETRVQAMFPLAEILHGGLGGSTLSIALTDFSTKFSGPKSTLFPTMAGLAICWSGSNDIENGDSSATIIANYTTLVNSFRSAGFQKVMAITVQPRTFTGDSVAKNAVRAAVNTWINTGGAFDAVADVCALPELSTDGAFNTSGWYATDLTHFNTTGWSNVWSRSIRAAVNKFVTSNSNPSRIPVVLS